MNRTIKDIQKDIELLGIKGGYDIEQLLTPQDCRRLSYEIERLQKQKEELQINGLRQETLFKLEIERLESIIKEVREYINENEDYFYNYPLVSRERLLEILDKEKDNV